MKAFGQALDRLINRRRFVSLLGNGTVVALVPGWSRALGQQTGTGHRTLICSEYSGNGELIRAWFGNGQNRVQLALTKEGSSSGVIAQLIFTQGDELLLRLLAAINPSSEGQSLGHETLTATGQGFSKFTLDLDASRVMLDKAGEPEGLAKVVVTYGGKSWQGALDVKSGASVGLDDAPRLGNVLPETTISKIKPLAPPLEALSFRAEFRVKEGRSRLESSQSGEKNKKPWLCHAACSSVSAILLAVCCAGSEGIGCIAAAGVFGAAGSICMDKVCSE